MKGDRREDRDGDRDRDRDRDRKETEAAKVMKTIGISKHIH